MGEFDEGRTGQAFGLVIAAAAATAVGSSAVFFPQLARFATANVLAASMGFAAGVMLYVSLVDIYGKSVGGFEDQGHDEDKSFIYTTLMFFAGILAMKVIDMFIHFLMNKGGAGDLEAGMDEMVARNEALQAGENMVMDEQNSSDSESGGVVKKADTERMSSDGEDIAMDEQRKQKLFTMGASTATAIALHNFPEGLVTFVSYVDDPAVGAALAIGIAIHNIPEGLCVAMPIYYATGSKWKGFFWGTLSGFSEPLGALVGWLIVKTSFSGNTYGILFGLVAGVMTFITLDELLPMGYKYNPHGGIVTWTCVFGMFMIALSLMLFSV